MTKIRIQKNKEIIRELTLSEGTVTIGRNKDNDIQLDDPSVSAYHAKIVTFFKPTYVQDLRSTNGTYVNGRRMMEHTLKHGDQIMIGQHILHFDMQSQGEAADESIEPEYTVELNKADISQLLKN
jgi:pSer/pThr/pTyr-binding forkhead associated (FHA) protein